MVEKMLNVSKESGYQFVEKRIENYVWSSSSDTFIVKIGVGRHPEQAYYTNEIVYKYNSGIEFFNDWWEGEPYVAVLGILPVNDIKEFDVVAMEN